MTRSFDIIDELIELLTGNDITDEKFSVIRAYEIKYLPVPVSQMYLSLAADSVKVTYFEDENSEYCESTEITIRLNCFAPTTELPHLINHITEPVLDLINDRYPDSVKGYSIDEAVYDSKTKAIRQTALVKFGFESCAAEGSVSDSLTVPKNFFCKSHVNDKDVHVTGAEKELISRAFTRGEYVGDGSVASQDIVVGFPSRYIIVYRKSSHISAYDSASGKVINYMGFASYSAVTKGLAMTSIGFRADNVSDSKGETRLNEDGVTYAYIAYK